MQCKQVLVEQINTGKGVRWEFDNNLVEILERGKKIEGSPTPDPQYVVVIYPMDHEVYRAPNNAVVYNADGSVHLQLTAPEPISELSKTRVRNLAKTKKFNPPHRLYFDGVSWAKVRDKVETVVKIGFDRDWWERGF